MNREKYEECKKRCLQSVLWMLYFKCYILNVLFSIILPMELIVQTVSKIHVTERIKILLFAVSLFCLPLFLSWPQLLVGSVVNLLLIWASLELSWSALIPMAMLPSLGAVMHGVVFWPFTIFLAYMLPVIRCGNLILMYVVKKFMSGSHSISKMAVSILSGWVLKISLLFGATYLLFVMWVLPVIFLKAMSMVQLATVIMWGLVVVSGKKVFSK